jgi:hemolysin III
VEAFREPLSAGTHALGLVLALPAAAFLFRRARGEPAKRVCVLVYGVGLVWCYAASTLYHGARAAPGHIAMLARIDYIGIYLLIAGTYTPLAWSLLTGAWRRALLGAVWLVSGTAVALILGGVTFPRVVSTGLYLGLGWGFVVCYVRIARVLSHRMLRPLIAGGLSYSTGAVLNLVGWPVLWPGVFAAHELFHVFVLAGSAAHYGFILRVIVPSRRTLADHA